MIDINKLNRADQYIKKMIDGIDPITETEASENDLINNPRIKECFLYIHSIICETISKEGVIKYIPYFVTDEQKSTFTAADDTVYFYDFTDALNRYCDENGCTKLHHTHIFSYLKKIGFLNNNNKLPTEVGIENGFIQVTINRNNRDYNICALEPRGQEYIINNLDNLLEFINSEEYFQRAL